MSTIDLSMYPNPPNGFKRICIELEPKDSEELCKIELIPGKKMKVDCNQHRLAGELLQKSIQGWGYSYYYFETKGLIISTQMACPEEELQEKYIASESKIMRYNSTLPIILIIPAGYDIQYRIWNGQEKTNEAVEG